MNQKVGKGIFAGIAAVMYIGLMLAAPGLEGSLVAAATGVIGFVAGTALSRMKS